MLATIGEVELGARRRRHRASEQGVVGLAHPAVERRAQLGANVGVGGIRDPVVRLGGVEQQVVQLLPIPQNQR